MKRSQNQEEGHAPGKRVCFALDSSSVATVAAPDENWKTTPYPGESTTQEELSKRTIIMKDYVRGVDMTLEEGLMGKYPLFLLDCSMLDYLAYIIKDLESSQDKGLMPRREAMYIGSIAKYVTGAPQAFLPSVSVSAKVFTKTDSTGTMVPHVDRSMHDQSASSVAGVIACITGTPFCVDFNFIRSVQTPILPDSLIRRHAKTPEEYAEMAESGTIKSSNKLIYSHRSPQKYVIPSYVFLMLMKPMFKMVAIRYDMLEEEKGIITINDVGFRMLEAIHSTIQDYGLVVCHIKYQYFFVGKDARGDVRIMGHKDREPGDLTDLASLIRWICKTSEKELTVPTFFLPIASIRKTSNYFSAMIENCMASSGNRGFPFSFSQMINREVAPRVYHNAIASAFIASLEKYVRKHVSIAPWNDMQFFYKGRSSDDIYPSIARMNRTDYCQPLPAYCRSMYFTLKVIFYLGKYALSAYSTPIAHSMWDGLWNLMTEARIVYKEMSVIKHYIAYLFTIIQFVQMTRSLKTNKDTVLEAALKRMANERKMGDFVDWLTDENSNKKRVIARVCRDLSRKDQIPEDWMTIFFYTLKDGSPLSQFIVSCMAANDTHIRVDIYGKTNVSLVSVAKELNPENRKELTHEEYLKRVERVEREKRSGRKIKRPALVEENGKYFESRKSAEYRTFRAPYRSCIRDMRMHVRSFMKAVDLTSLQEADLYYPPDSDHRKVVDRISMAIFSFDECPYDVDDYAEEAGNSDSDDDD